MSDAANPIPVETLLAERAWVTALARSLVLDDATADDVVQQTWLAALERPPRGTSALRGWLSRVVRNAANESRRRAKRRARWEAMTPAHPDEASPADVVAKADAHRRVVDAVMSLDEPYRSAVLLRFFEGLETDEVARRTGVPLETARTRIKRALATLRGRLDRDHGGDGRAWALALLPLTGTKHAVAASATGGAVVAISMKTVVAASAASALLAVLGTRAAMSPSEEFAPLTASPEKETADSPKSAPRERRPQPSRHAATAPATNAQTGAPSLAQAIAETPVDLPSRAAAPIGGRVRTQDGKALAGVVVRAVARRAPANPSRAAWNPPLEETVRAAVVEAKWRAATSRETKTDAAGEFRFADVFDAPYAVEAVADGWDVKPAANADASNVRPGATIDLVLVLTHVPVVVLMPDATPATEKATIRFGIPGRDGGTHPISFRWTPEATVAPVIPGTWTAFAELGTQLRSAQVEFTTPSDVAVPTLTLHLAPVDGSLLAMNASTKDGNVLFGLRWLKLHQGADGRWIDPATTSIALLPFLGAGETHQAGSSREMVNNGLKYLRDRQGVEGRIVDVDGRGTLRDHAVAALAIVEAFATTGSRVFEEPAQKAVAFAFKPQGASSPWRGTAGADLDVETTAWLVLLAKSAQAAQLDVDKSVLDDAVAAIDRVTDRATGRVTGPGPMSDEAATAVGVLARIFAGRSAATDDAVVKGAAYLRAHPPTVESGRATDLNACYFGTLAAFQVGGDTWRAWNDAMKTSVLDRQRAEDAGDERGSWDAASGASDADRVWTTAIGLLCTEVYLRYGRAVGVK
jgi:RNA polymerase sigma factor (sigma-70 family)